METKEQEDTPLNYVNDAAAQIDNADDVVELSETLSHSEPDYDEFSLESLFRTLSEDETNISADEDFPESPIESILNSSSLMLFFDDWRKEMRKKSPSSSYWENALRLELLLLMFVCSITTDDFELYKQSISQILGFRSYTLR